MGQGGTDVRSTVAQAVVLPGTEVYTQLHCVNDSHNMADFHSALDDMYSFFEVAGCTFPVRELADKRKIIFGRVKFHLVDRVCSCYVLAVEERDSTTAVV